MHLQTYTQRRIADISDEGVAHILNALGWRPCSGSDAAHNREELSAHVEQGDIPEHLILNYND